MPEMYRNKIVEAFRDNAIRSVLLIDDEYLPFEKMVNLQIEFGNSLKTIAANVSQSNTGVTTTCKADIDQLASNVSSNLMRTDIAKVFLNFFHSKKLICDVEDQANSLDKDKIRKSDLIVLDYYLEKQNSTNNPAKYSLKLVEELSRSKHMNIVVIYTNEELDKVWFEVAATLHGSYLGDVQSFLSDQALNQKWINNQTEWEEEWEHIFSKDIYEKFLKSEHDIMQLTRELIRACEDKDYELPNNKHVEWLLEKGSLRDNKNSYPSSKLNIHGTRKKWLQAGDVFVVFCSKETYIDEVKRETSPSEVWELIKETLIDWYPSFYRVVTSELQNQIEDANLSMQKVLMAGTTEQIAALWGVLRVETSLREQASKEFLNSLLTDVVAKIQNSSELLNFIVETANSVVDVLPEYVSAEINKEKHANYLKKIVESASENLRISSDKITKEFRGDVLHAFNEQLSIEKALPNHISTGVVLKDIDNNIYYLCIAPSCNTVPKQTTGMVAKAMTPHRPMRFIKLVDVTDRILDHLKDAHKSHVIFLSDEGKRLALNVYESQDVPTIEQGVVVEHDTIPIVRGSYKEVQFFVTNHETSALETVKRKFAIVAKLRPAFASRYQNYQVQYEARIGVDLVSANMK